MARTTSVEDGETIKGFRVKLYPTQEGLHYLASRQRELMDMWNVLVTTWQTHSDHCLRHCEEHGVVAPLPTRPQSERNSNVPDEIAEWNEYERLCRERRRIAVQHCKAVAGLTRVDWANRAAAHHGVSLTEKAKTQSQIDYRVLRSAVPGEATAHMVLALIESYKAALKPGKPPPVLKKRSLHMPLLLRSGKRLLQLPQYGVRLTATGKERLTGSRECEVRFGPLHIKGRFHRPPPGPFLEGIAITLEHDGWYAAAKARCTSSIALPQPTKEVIAINPGLQCLYADSEGRVIDNPRANSYSLQVREFSEWIDEADSQWDEVYRRNQLGRYQQRFARHVEDLIYSEVLPMLSDYDTILIGRTGRKAAQGPQSRVSKNDEGGYVSAMYLMQKLIIQRYGEYDPDKNPAGRVRLVESSGISRRCSRCSTEHESWYHRDNSKRPDQQTNCQEPSCRLRIHVDVNAARNLVSNYLETQRAAE